jgi:glycosyltransferase involved in cell wall biosynthesis
MKNYSPDIQAPLITIITVCRNPGQALQNTIENVSALNYPRKEFIIIDGGSTDGTIAILKKYADQFKYWISEPDKGIYDAMNKGWDKAEKSSYIIYLGAGDLLTSLPAPDMIKADVIAGEVQIGNKFLFKPKMGLRLKLGNTLHHQALLVKKSIHPSAPFDRKFRTYADFDFNQRLHRSGVLMCVNPQLKGYAAEGGVSTKFNREESLSVVAHNFGWLYVQLAKLYYLLRHEI